MLVGLLEFISLVFNNGFLFLTVVLIMAVILINGWTDAPNAIATCISTRAISPRLAIFIATIFNFLGVFIMSIVNAKVASTIYRMVDFGGNHKQALIALSAAMVGIVIWATLAWFFGIPTSESHALIAGISGGAIALQNSISGINGHEWIKVVYGVAFSTIIGFSAGLFITKFIKYLFKKVPRKKAQDIFTGGQIISASTMAFMHGAQDGQKFMGVFMLSIFLSQENYYINEFFIPFWLIVLCSLLMAIGTSIGGYRIIKTIGMDMVKLEKYQGFASDIASSSSLFISSLLGIPVSTTHMKITGIMGAGFAKRPSSVKWDVAGDLVVTWILTFPGCGLIGFLIAKLFIIVF